MSDAPILGCANVAHLFGISPSTLRRWLRNPEIEERYKLRDFTFRLGSRIATTPRLAAQFIDYVRSLDPREDVRREVADVVEALKKGVA